MFIFNIMFWLFVIDGFSNKQMTQLRCSIKNYNEYGYDSSKYVPLGFVTLAEWQCAV